MRFYSKILFFRNLFVNSRGVNLTNCHVLLDLEKDENFKTNEETTHCLSNFCCKHVLRAAKSSV